MLRTFFLVLFLTTSSFSAVKNLQGVYKIEYGIFGKLGIAKTSIKVDKNKYEIKAKAYATGLAKFLSGNLTEEFLSRGSFVNDSFKPSYFRKTTTKRGNIKTVEFLFDHQNKKITKKEYRKEKKRKLDPNDLSKIEYKYIEKTKEEILPFWTKEDILSLFFNVKKYIDVKEKGIKKIVSAVGASSKREGKIDIIVPTKTDYDKISKYLEDKNDILIVKIYKKIFASKKGEFFLSIDKDGLCTKSVLKDVLFFGDITATLEKKNKI